MGGEYAMTLWIVLMMINMVMPIAGAVATWNRQHAGLGGWGIAVFIGVAIGAISVWMLWAMGRWVDRSPHPEGTAMTWRLRLLYAVAFAWPFVTLFGSGFLSGAVLAGLTEPP
jgi:hypothetical protein